MKSLDEARTEVKAALNDGTTCPCCDQWVKIYKFPFNTSLVKALRAIYDAHTSGIVGPEEYFHVERYFKSLPEIQFQGVHGKMKFWGLIESESEGKPRSGRWRITQKGRDFVEGHIAIAKYALLYQNRCLGHEGPMLYIEQVVESFSLDEVMSATNAA